MRPAIQTESFARRITRWVNRGLNDIIQASPYTKYRVDLLTAGLEDNPVVNLSLADKRSILDEYRAKWDEFNPIEREQRKIDNFVGCSLQASAFGYLGDWERS